MRPTDFGIPQSARSRSPSCLLHKRGFWLSNTGTPDNCLRREWSDWRLGLAPARADSTTSEQPIPMPRHARALAFAGMISIARSFRIAVPTLHQRTMPSKKTDLKIANLARVCGHYEGTGAAQAPANSIRGARDIRVDDDPAHDCGNARGRVRARGHGDAASGGAAAHEGPR
jgi:hypothetical protein